MERYSEASATSTSVERLIRVTTLGNHSLEGLIGLTLVHDRKGLRRVEHDRVPGLAC